MAARDLQQKGLSLRKDIDDAYKERAASNKLSAAPARTGEENPNSLTEIVLQYIPIGTSFDDAEQVLRYAGFKVDPRPTANPASRLPDRHNVVASIVPFEQGLFSKVSIYVDLIPQSPADYSAVSNLSAAFTVSSP